MIIKELVNIESLSKGELNYTVLKLDSEHCGKVIFTLCPTLKINDLFLTNEDWSPIWFKDNLQNYFKLMEIKEYLDISLNENDANSRNFVNQVVIVRSKYMDKVRKR